MKINSMQARLLGWAVRNAKFNIANNDAATHEDALIMMKVWNELEAQLDEVALDNRQWKHSQTDIWLLLYRHAWKDDKAMLIVVELTAYLRAIDINVEQIHKFKSILDESHAEGLTVHQTAVRVLNYVKYGLRGTIVRVKKLVENYFLLK